MTPCSKCGDPAQVAMSFAYSARAVWLRDLGPGFNRYSDYPLCEMHAERLSAPAGWDVSDERANQPPLFLTSDVA